MLNQDKVFKVLKNNNINFYVGVPDSYLNGFCDYALKNCKNNNIIAANEGNAVGIAAGHYFATKEIPLVYLQNSGLGITINPLVSLAHKDVYAVPMLILVGWRGQENSEPNHPQHKMQGEITPKTFDLLNIPYAVLSDNDEEFAFTIKEAISYCNNIRQPYALIAPKGVMASNNKPNNIDSTYPMSREEAIEVILDYMPSDTICCATTGRATRELFYLRELRNETKANDYLNVGSMGHSSSVALGIALEKPNRKVVVLDGDSAAMMHMGAMTTIGRIGPKNLMHIVLNNGSHESVGGQPSAGYEINFTKIAESCGYETAGKTVESKEDLINSIKLLNNSNKTSFIDCRIHKGLRRDLPPIVFDHRKAIDSLINNLNKNL